MRIQIELLEDESYFGPEHGHVGPRIGYIHAVNRDVAFLNRLKPINTSNKGGFAGTGWSTDDDNFTFFNFKIYVVEDMKIPIPFIYIFERNHSLSPKEMI